MSSFAGYCDQCGKPVMYKTLFGTLHVCLSSEERAARAMQLQQSSIGYNLNKLTGGMAGKPYRRPTTPEEDKH